MSLDTSHRNALDRIEWILCEAKLAAELSAPGANTGLKVLVPDAPGDPAIDGQITELKLYGSATVQLARFPKRVSALHNLRILAMGPGIDAKMLADIGPGSIPASVTALGVFTSGATAVWPQAVSLPSVTDLRTEGIFMFSHENFPNLRAVSLDPARNGKNLDAALECKDLAELQLLTVPKDGIFARLKHLPLRKLGLLGGGLTTLNGINAAGGIDWLRLHNLRSLQSIAAIVDLSQLQDLEIRYCKKIEDIDCIAKLPKLRRLEVVACGNVGLSRIQPMLGKLEKVLISASS